MLMKKIQEISPSGFGMRKEGTIIFKYTSTFYITRSCSLWVKIDVFGKISEFKTGWYICNMNLEHPIVPENKAVLKKKKNHYDESMSKRYRNPTKKTPNGQDWNISAEK